MKTIERLEDLTPDVHNANEGSLRGEQLLERSFDTHGAGRSIVVDKNGIVIGGNKALQAAIEHGLTVKVVQSNGTKLIAVHRVDLDITDPKTRELAYLDNRVAQVGLKWNPAQLEADLADGVELGGMFDEAEREELLRMLDQAEVRTKVHFDDQAQLDQFLRMIALVDGTERGETTGARLTQWVLKQLVALDPSFQVQPADGV